MKTALLVSYHWPPSGGAGVYRWLKMARYLPEHGWRVIVYTPTNPERPVHDESLLADLRPDQQVLTHRIWEPYTLYKWLSGRRRSERMYSGFINDGRTPTFTQELAAWLRGNLLIPDPRCFWVRPAVRHLLRELPALGVDALITTGPPHSMHLIGRAVAHETGLPWVADFRDPWTGIHYFPRLRLTGWARARHTRLEKAVTREATRLVTVSRSWATDFAALAGRPVAHISNGYDPAEFASDDARQVRPLSIAHIGSMGAERNPEVLWRALARLKREGVAAAAQMQVTCYGVVDQAIMASARQYDVHEQLQILGYLPHKDAIEAMCQSALLLLVVNRSEVTRGVVPGKLYEYLASRRPVLLVGHQDGDAALLLRELNAGWSADFDDEDAVLAALRQLLAQPCLSPTEGSAAAAYSRAALARDYAALLDDMLASRNGPA